MLLLIAGCAVPEPATGPPPSQGPVGGGSGSQASCSCYFETWSLTMPCGTRCLGDSKLSCSASSASVDPRGCAVGVIDGGQDSDAGVVVVNDFDGGPGETSDAGISCTPDVSTCGCLIYPYETDGFSITIPCCSTLCVASQRDRAWACSSEGVTIVSPAVCRR